MSNKQIHYAEENRNHSLLKNLISFDNQDFTKTTFSDNSFDIVWACESSYYANPKELFIQEVNRLLKPGGKLILSDYFLTEAGLTDQDDHLKNWAKTWAIDQLNTTVNILDVLDDNQF